MERERFSPLGLDDYLQVLEESNILEGARNPPAGDGIWPQPGYLLPPEKNFSLGRFQGSRDHVEDGGLPGPVGADQPHQIPSLQL